MQTEFNANRDQLIEGMVTPYSVTEKITLIPTETVGFGKAVKRGTVEGTGSNLAEDGTDDVVVGISVHRHLTEDGYLEGHEMAVLTKGAIAVSVLDGVTVAAGEEAFVVVDAGATFGKFTNVAGVNTASTGGVFQSAKKNDNLAIVKINIVA
jgi:hypothetical protein